MSWKKRSKNVAGWRRINLSILALRGAKARIMANAKRCSENEACPKVVLIRHTASVGPTGKGSMLESATGLDPIL